MSYKMPISVRVHDTDFQRFARPSSIWRYFQEAANHQMKEEGPSYDDLLQQGYSFLLSRMAVDFVRPIYQYEKLVSETFVLPSAGFSFERGYRLLDAEEKTVASGIAVWAVVNLKTGHLVRTTDIELSYSGGIASEVKSPLRFLIPADAKLKEAGSREIRYSDVDVNRHLNNTNYPDFFFDFLPNPTMENLKSMSLNYKSEAPLGTTLKVYCFGEETEENGTRYWLRSMNGKSVNAECLMEFKKGE